MSKLYLLNQYRYSPAAGGLGSLLKGAVNLVAGVAGVGQVFKKGQKAPPNVFSPTQQQQMSGGWTAAAQGLVQGAVKAARGAKGGGGTGVVRRGRGITARELRGYRKVANLIHKEGMVSKRARGRH